MDQSSVPARWEPGAEVVLRYITRIDGQVGMSWPFRVVRDEPDLLALYLPAGSTFMRWHNPPGGGRTLVEGEWRRDVLRLMYPGKNYSIWLFWEGPAREFTMYYVNFEEPFRRTPLGVDTNDHTLDIVIKPDFSWEWKDFDDFEGTLTAGTYSTEFAEFVRSSAKSVLTDLESRASPFSDSWHTWAPPSDWTHPVLHPRWREEPPVLWERHHWAYPMTAVARPPGC
ncbi:MAG: DUF402 domain-containing protein [Dehalococcoidia bacterium]